jgi:hypothetical protein
VSWTFFDFIEISVTFSSKILLFLIEEVFDGIVKLRIS